MARVQKTEVSAAGLDGSGDFEAVFRATLARIEADARSIRVPMLELSAAVGISRANMSRWKRGAPATVRKIAELQAEIRRRQAGGGTD
jgi:hypothetical protein